MALQIDTPSLSFHCGISGSRLGVINHFMGFDPRQTRLESLAQVESPWRRLPARVEARVEHREAEGGGEEGAAAGEAGGHSMA
jgi:hypothetical protein